MQPRGTAETEVDRGGCHLTILVVEAAGREVEQLPGIEAAALVVECARGDPVITVGRRKMAGRVVQVAALDIQRARLGDPGVLTQEDVLPGARNDGLADQALPEEAIVQAVSVHPGTFACCRG